MPYATQIFPKHIALCQQQLVTEDRQVPWRLGYLVGGAGTGEGQSGQRGAWDEKVTLGMLVYSWLSFCSHLEPAFSFSNHCSQFISVAASSCLSHRVLFMRLGSLQTRCQHHVRERSHVTASITNSFCLLLNGLMIPQSLWDITSRSPEHSRVQRCSDPFCKMAAFAQNLYPLSRTMQITSSLVTMC